MTYKRIIILVIGALLIAAAALSFARPAPPANTAAGPKPLPKASATKTVDENNPLVDYEADKISRRGPLDSTIYLVGNVKFHHNGAIIECDSAARYDANRMDFFGKVIINKDSAYIYADRVNYDGRTAIAEVFSPLVKMLRGDVTMYTYNLRFNTKTNIATYSGGGIVTQTDKFMESLRGEYNADRNVIKFLDSVEMRSETYNIKTDSLDYNLDTETATFLARTTVWDKDSSILIANRGYYFNKQKTYKFSEKAYVMTKEQEMWADTMTYFTTMRQATMLGNVQVLDTTQRTIALSDWAFYDDSLGIAMLTRMPSVRAYSEDKKDTSFMRADSIFMLTFAPGMTPRGNALDSVNNALDSVVNATSQKTLSDSIAKSDINNNIPVQDSIITDFLPTDTLSTANHSIVSQPIVESQTEPKTDIPNKKLSPRKERKERRKQAKEEAITKALEADALETGYKDSILKEVVATDSIAMNQIADSVAVMDSALMSDSLYTATDSTANIKEKPKEKERIIRAYHNVRSWAKDYQMVCDSTVGYSVDSMAQMFGKPILWSQNNQITSDQIDIYSANEEIDWVDFIGSPFIVQKVEPKWREPEDSSRYNQASGREMQAYFKNNEIDSAVMSGNVINYYYMESDGYTSAFATITCPRLVIFFANREPMVMRWERDTKFDIYPLDQIPADNTQQLPGFAWHEDVRPQNAKEISDRELRNSQRLQIESLPKPRFSIEEQIKEYRRILVESGSWHDRTEQTTATPEYFENQNIML